MVKEIDGREKNDSVVPRTELAMDARTPVCQGAGKCLFIHYLQLGSDVLIGSQGTCASPGLGRRGSYKPL